MIRAERLTKVYGAKTVVNSMSFEIEKGHIVGFLGPNGAGKTTTLRMITGLVAPTIGSVYLNDIDAALQPDLATRSYGYVPDSPFLYPKLTGPELLQFVAAVRGIPSTTVKRFADTWISRFELDDWTSAYLDECSLGTKRKWAILTALLHSPEILILDEPLNGLDPKSVRIVKDLFLELRGKGRLVFMSTHLLDVVSTVCDSVMIINKGHLVLPLTSLDHLESVEETFLHVTEAAAGIDL